MSRGRRTVTRSTTDPKLTPLQDAIEGANPVDPALATELRAHSMGTRDEARKTRGSIDGNGGPRMMMLSGYETPGDGGEGVFLWDPTSPTADDEGVTTLAPLDGAVGRWKRAQLYPDPVPPVPAVLGFQVITSGTSYVKTPGTTAIIIELWGGGAAGGGANVTGAATVSAGGGGASGGYLRKRITGLGAGPFTIAIGAGGAGVSAGAGGSGGDTTFNDGTTTYTAKGGSGGQASAAVAVPTAANGGQKGTVSTNGDVNASGANGTYGLCLTTTTAVGGHGGNTSLGGAGFGGAVSSGGQAAVANTGSGGSGAAGNNAGAQTGGNGATGPITVLEFG